MDIALVQPPFAPLERPSMALGLLKPCLEAAGMSARVYYANLWLANEVGVDRYSVPNQMPIQLLVGEWIFSAAAFPDFRLDESLFYGPLAANWPGLESAVAPLRAQAAAFIDRTARRILADKPRIVGCSSVFQQHCASLALLRRVKEIDPSVVTVLGGSNCEGTMGQVVHRAFTWVDYVVSGEAESSFPALCCQILAGQEAALPPWILGPAQRSTAAKMGRGLVLDLNHTPVPDFYDYFAELEASPQRAHVHPCLIAETSRGCWWGAKHHCTFCGLNGGGMGFRSKAPERVAAEFGALVERHGLNTIETVDNILDMSYLDSLAPQLEALEKPIWLFYETKANLRHEQLVKMARLGIRWLQPGIESLHDRVLKLMDKGTTALQNVQLLKWARELGIVISWNLLVDFPGEEDDWYAETCGFMERLFHLQPPSGAGTVRYDRYSPYHVRPQDYGVVLKTGRFYALVYPLPPEDLADLAYFFEDGVGSVRNPSTRVGPWKQQLRQLVRHWRERFCTRPTVLSLDDDGSHLDLFDSRPCAVERRHRLSGLARTLYLACDSARSRRSLLEVAGSEQGEVEAVLADLDRRKLTLELNGKVLALAVRGDMPSVLQPEDFRLGHVEHDAIGLLFTKTFAEGANGVTPPPVAR